MKMAIYFSAIFITIATLFPAKSSAQDKRFVTISPSVGEVIDSMEAQRAMSGNLTILRMISDEITNFINRIS